MTSLKERLAAEKEAALTYENIAKQVEGILVEAAKDGRSSVLIYLDNENDCKTQFMRYFLTQEGINFEKAYDTYTATKLLNFPISIPTWVRVVMRVSTLINQSL